MFWVTLAGVVVVALYTTVAAWQAELTRNQISLGYPARLRIMDVWILPNDFALSKELRASASVINTGRETATITDTWCLPYWETGKPPMIRPYLDPAHKNLCGDLTAGPGVTDTKVLDPGRNDLWNFTIKVPDKYAAIDLYILGAVAYSDRLTERRWVLFGRRYDRTERRFIAVNIPEYENQIPE